MQKVFARLAIASSGGTFETISEMSHRTGMDIYILKTWIDQLFKEGEIERIETPDGVRYSAKEEEGEI